MILSEYILQLSLHNDFQAKMAIKVMVCSKHAKTIGLKYCYF